MRPLGKSHRRIGQVEHTREDNGPLDPDFEPLDEEDLPEPVGIEIDGEWYQDGCAFFLDQEGMDWIDWEDDLPKLPNRGLEMMLLRGRLAPKCESNLCCHDHCDCRFADELFMRAFEEPSVQQAAASLTSDWQPLRREDGPRSLGEAMENRKVYSSAVHVRNTFMQYTDALQFDNAEAISQVAHELVSAQVMNYGVGDRCACAGVRRSRVKWRQF